MVGGSKGVLVPWQVVVVAVVAVVVSVAAGVTVVVVDVTVTTSVRVDSNAWVKGQWELAVFIQQPLNIDHRGQQDLRAVNLNEERPGVRLG